MIIRRGKKADVEKAIELYHGIWPEDKKEKVRRYFQEKVKKKEIFVAVKNKKVIGFITFIKRYFKNSDFIDEVIIHKDYYRLGIASALIKRVEEDAKKRKSRRVFSSTERDNKVSLNLHRKLGYKKAGYINHMWEEGEREIILSKKLK